MKMNKRWIAPVVGAVMVATAGTALACSSHGGRDGGPMGASFHERMPYKSVYRVDGLTDKQREKLDALFDANQDAMYTKMKSWRKDSRELHDAIRNNADAATIKPLAQKEGDHVAEMIVQRAELRTKIDAILTPEQRKQLADMSQRPQRRDGEGDDFRGRNR